MNPVYVAIVAVVVNIIVMLLGFAWKAGSDNQKLETLRSAHNDLSEDIEAMRDVDVEHTKELANIRGYLRGEKHVPINGGAN